MTKRITIPAIVAILILCLAALAVSAVNIITAQADETAATEIATVNSGFTFGDEGKTILTGIDADSLPAGDFKLEIPSGVQTIADRAFTEKPVVSVNIPSSVTVIGQNAFENCSKLEEVTLNEGLTSIGANAFAGTTQLRDIVFPSTLKTIREHAFNGCSGLNRVQFARESKDITVWHYAFASCINLGVITLPNATEVRQYAFNGCSSLLWIYVGKDCKFIDTNSRSANFFPTDTNLKIIYTSKAAYDAMKADSRQVSFRTAHEAKTTYEVAVKLHIGNAYAVEHIRLHGQAFSYVSNANGEWNEDTAYSQLPVQASHYASTVWYTNAEMTSKTDEAAVNALLNGNSDVIDLYCHATIDLPAFASDEPVSWVADDEKSYDITSLKDVLTALGCKTDYTEAQLAALKFSVSYADSDGNAQTAPEAISQAGAYNVVISLDPSYGVWNSNVTSSITVNVNTGSFNVVLIVFLVIGVLAVAATVSTAIIRKRVQARNKKKVLTQQEVLEKFRAAGGETDLR